MLRKIGQKAGRVVLQLAYAGFMVSGAACVFMTVLVTAGALSRYLFRAPITTVPEATDLLMLVVAMFAGAYTQTVEGHLRVDLLTLHLPRTAQSICHNIFGPIVGMVWCAVGIWKGFEMMLSAYKLGFVCMWLYRLPIWPLYWVIILGLALLFLTLLALLIRTVGTLYSARRRHVEAG